MKYIESIILENFQSHRKTTIQPAPPGQLTVIVGPSDSGKTAIIRGLKWCAFNSPQGADFIRVGAQAASVTCTMSDGSTITRYRSRGGVNRYFLGEENWEQIFESFGSSVPLEVKQAVEMEPVAIGDLEFLLNIAEQLDGPFLGNATPATARAKALGKLSGVEEVDHANKTLGTDLYRKRRELEGIEAEISRVKNKIEEYAYLDELGPLIDIVDAAVTSIREKIEKKQKLLELRLKLTGVMATIDQEEEKLAGLAALDTAEEKIGDLLRQAARHQQLSAARQEIPTLDSQIVRAASTIAVTQKIQMAADMLLAAESQCFRLLELRKLAAADASIAQDISNSEKMLTATEKIPSALNNLENIHKLVAKLTPLSQIKISMQVCRQDICAAQKDLEESSRTVSQLADELANVYREAAVCPLCGNRLEPEKLMKEAI